MVRSESFPDPSSHVTAGLRVSQAGRWMVRLQGFCAHGPRRFSDWLVRPERSPMGVTLPSHTLPIPRTNVRPLVDWRLNQAPAAGCWLWAFGTSKPQVTQRSGRSGPGTPRADATPNGTRQHIGALNAKALAAARGMGLGTRRGELGFGGRSKYCSVECCPSKCFGNPLPQRCHLRWARAARFRCWGSGPFCCLPSLCS